MGIKNIIYDTLEADNKQWTPVNHNPSSASFKYSDGHIIGKDLLTLYYKWTNVPPSNPIGPGSLLRMRLGDGTHMILSQILAKAGIKAMSEVAGKFQHPNLKRPISYRVDGLHELKGDLEVLEVKSTTDQVLLGKGWGIRDTGPKDEHLLQVICYLNLVPGVKRSRLLYISRDSGEMVEFTVNKNIDDSYNVNDLKVPELSFSGIVDRWFKLEQHLESKIEPKPEFKVWLNEENELMPVKQIKGKKYKSDWEATYSPYLNKIYLDPKNYDFVTYNAEFKAKGLL